VRAEPINKSHMLVRALFGRGWKVAETKQHRWIVNGDRWTQCPVSGQWSV